MLAMQPTGYAELNCNVGLSHACICMPLAYMLTKRFALGMSDTALYTHTELEDTVLHMP